MRTFFIVVSVCLALVLMIDKLYFPDLKMQYGGGRIDEGFVRDGALGRILRNAGLIDISDQSFDIASNDFCADTEELKGIDNHNQFRFRVKIQATRDTKLLLVAIVGQHAPLVRNRQWFTVVPGREYYSMIFKAEQGQTVRFKYVLNPKSTNKKTTATLLDAYIDGQFGRTWNIISNGQSINSSALSIDRGDESLPKDTENKMVMSGKVLEVLQTYDKGIEKILYQGTFPGKKHKGYCTYSAVQNPGSLDRKFLPEPKAEKATLLPRVLIKTDESNLYGETGLLDNKQKKGVAWEKSATLSINNKVSVQAQKIGLRYHGGGPGRKKDIESFRVLARNSYGKGVISAEALLGEPSEIDFKSLVFKYTYLVRGQGKVEDFNPFVHALALDIGQAIGALVPRHALVDLTVNDDHKGLFLAMEHFSRRTVRHWLDHDDFRMLTYKSGNTKAATVAMYKIAGDIKKLKGDAAFEYLKNRYSIDNVIDSVLLSSYIGDNDFCQGVDIQRNIGAYKEITSLNWDLDHAFFTTKGGQAKITPDLYGFRLLLPKKSFCVRQRIYAWAFLQSDEFRSLVKQRLESLLNGILSAEKSGAFLDYYKQLNQTEFDGRYTQQVQDLEDFMTKRPAILREQFAALEVEVNNIDRLTFKW